MSEASDELSMIGGRTGTNIALGGATTPLVSALKIDNEAEGTLDLSTFVFTESEKEYLLGIDTRFEMLAKYLLVNGEDNVDNANESNSKGSEKAEWMDAFMNAKSFQQEGLGITGKLKGHMLDSVRDLGASE
jgi:hypothetical protein